MSISLAINQYNPNINYLKISDNELKVMEKQSNTNIKLNDIWKEVIFYLDEQENDQFNEVDFRSEGCKNFVEELQKYSLNNQEMKEPVTRCIHKLNSIFLNKENPLSKPYFKPILQALAEKDYSPDQIRLLYNSLDVFFVNKLNKLVHDVGTTLDLNLINLNESAEIDEEIQSIVWLIKMLKKEHFFELFHYSIEAPSLGNKVEYITDKKLIKQNLIQHVKFSYLHKVFNLKYLNLETQTIDNNRIENIIFYFRRFKELVIPVHTNCRLIQSLLFLVRNIPVFNFIDEEMVSKIFDSYGTLNDYQLQNFEKFIFQILDPILTKYINDNQTSINNNKAPVDGLIKGLSYVIDYFREMSQTELSNMPPEKIEYIVSSLFYFSYPNIKNNVFLNDTDGCIKIFLIQLWQKKYISDNELDQILYAVKRKIPLNDLSRQEISEFIKNPSLFSESYKEVDLRGLSCVEILKIVFSVIDILKTPSFE